ncbi:serine/threonine-protein kinase, partial [Streptomyces griseosporeus]|uniref:serine/threonine-protein kinase n=1 Tax=Streptomyces griseosporeus TaxID=1910 RepID=UPI0036745271
MQALRATDPRRIGPYEVLGRLGAGGMGEVYLAASRAGLRAAVKVVRAEHAEDRTFRARFRHEVRAAQTVGGTGTYTARVVDADTEAERPWMATEFVDGPNLRDAVLDGGPLPGDAVRALAGALGEALAAIHAKGMVHRDLKPSNILLAQDGPRVIDFGIVRALEATSLTRTGTVVGSVGYVSPEQIRNGGEVGPPSDVFSLGAVLAYASAGREPFGEGQDSVVLLRILTRDYDLTGVPDGIRALVEACFAEDPHKRPTPQRVVTAVGHTSSTLRDALRPGWYGNPTAPPTAEPERWLPARDSGERLSGVEYVAPLTTTDTPAPARQPATAAAPALPGPSAPAPVPDPHASAGQDPAAADTPATPAPAAPTPAVADASPSPTRPAPSPGTPNPPQTPEPSPPDAPTPSVRPAPAPASAPEREVPATTPASGPQPAAPHAPTASGRPAPAPASAPEPAAPPASGSQPAAPHVPT